MRIFIGSRVQFDICNLKNENRQKHAIEKCKNAIENYNRMREFFFLVFRMTKQL